MRLQSKDQHDQSNKLVNLKLALVLTSKPLYAEAISLFWPIYRELELLLEKHKDHHQLGRLYPLLPILRRADLFEKDMESLLGDHASTTQLKARRLDNHEGKEKFSPPELQEYIDLLRKLSKEDPVMLVPYIYSMYSAILAGGWILKRMVSQAFFLKTEEGVAIYKISLEGSSFPNIAEFRSAMKRVVNDEMTLGVKDQERIVNETPNVFVRNNKLVATAQDSDIFQKVWTDCRRYLLVVSSLVVALFGIWIVKVRSGYK